jgi:hypothetical protein
MSPVNSFFIVVVYWTKMFSSKPHSWRIASICSSVGCLPAMRTAGSPFGITLKIRNVSTETANSTSTIEASLRATNLPMARRPP